MLQDAKSRGDKGMLAQMRQYLYMGARQLEISDEPAALVTLGAIC
jgi:hypothetical protein